MENYVHIRKIGEGSFGKALLMKRKEDGKQVAVKQISISKMSSKEREESKKEVRVLSQLKHPNVVSYIESFLGDGNLYIVMDYCEGGDLYQLIVRQRGAHMDESKVLDIFVQCCLAIKHIHDRKILHRDIKTQNIFLTRHHIVKLGDFGIARVLKSTMELARTCIGTPYYLSPEIVENKPYNNKSDVWSLGCVLYELATLKHAFEAGNMKNLVLKICRGSYNPVPNKYSFELRSLVAHCLKRNATDRPSINTLLKKPIIQQRIAKYLSPEEVKDEFSHTVIHGGGGAFRAARPAAPSRPSSVLPKKTPAVKRQKEQLAAVYGVSVAKKPVPIVRKPPAARPVAKPKSSGSQGAKHTGKREADARERRRKEILAQEQQYNEYMKKMQKQRWEKQQAVQMNRAREGGWKNVLGSDEVKKNAMKKYQPENEEKRSAKKIPSSEPEEKPSKQMLEALPLTRVKSPPNKEPQQQQQWLADYQRKREEVHVVGQSDQEKARILEDFWQRKKQADANKARWVEAIHRPNSILQIHEERMAKEKQIAAARPPVYPAARDNKEKQYLKQLEAIRRQNYMERKAMKDGQRNQISQPSPSPHADPRYDPDARKKKIEALKEQAEQRAVMLKQQLESRRKKVQDRLEHDRVERMRKWKEEKDSRESRPLPVRKDELASKEPVSQIKMVTPAVGLETAMNQVIQPKLFRSLSEGEIQNLVKQPARGQRRNWAMEVKQPLAFADIPLEITASAMEATKFIEPVLLEPNKQPAQAASAARKGWGNEGKTQFISQLHNFDLIGTVMSTMTLHAQQDVNAPAGKTIVVTSSTTKDSNKAKSSSNNSNSSGSSNNITSSNRTPGETIVISSTASKSGGQDSSNPSQAAAGSTITLPQSASSKASTGVQSISETITLSGPPSTKNTPIILAPSSADSESKENNVEAIRNPSTNATIVIASGEKTVGEKGTINIDDTNKNVGENATIIMSRATVTTNNASLVSDDKVTPEKPSSPRGVDVAGGTHDAETNLNKSTDSNSSPTPNSDQKTSEPVDVDAEDTIDLPDENCLKGMDETTADCRAAEQSESVKTAWIVANVEASQPKESTVNTSLSHEESSLSDESSFHTPNRTLGLQSGNYDVKERKLLRTCSLPDLRESLSSPPPPDNVATSLESHESDNKDMQFKKVSKKEEDMKVEDFDEFDDDRDNDGDNEGDNDGDDEGDNDGDDKGDNDGDDDGDNDVDDKGDNDVDDEGDNDGDDEGDNDGDYEQEEIDTEDAEEYEDYESMLESMRNVLGSKTARSQENEASNVPTEEKKEESNNRDENDDDDEWEEAGDTEDMDESSPNHKENDMLQGTLFSRIEESRQLLEDELGLELFIKIYRYVQMMQDNEDDALEIGTTEISELLGEKEHLYQKVLYLVMADSAYSEGNDGT